MARTVIFAEQTLTNFAYQSAFGCYAVTAPTLLFTLTEGQEYVAVFDGAEYTLTAASFTGGDGTTCVYIGNTLVQGGENNGIPFALVCDMTNGYTHVMSLDTASSHTAALYQEDTDSEGPTSQQVRLYNHTGTPQDYTVDKGIRLFSPDGTPRDFISSNPVETTVQPDFSAGDMEVLPGDGELFSKVTVQQPETLIAENIASGVNIAGIVGEFAGGAELKFASGEFTGNGSYVNVSHGLGVTPDIIFVRKVKKTASTSKQYIDACLAMSSNLRDKLALTWLSWYLISQVYNANTTYSKMGIGSSSGLNIGVTLVNDTTFRVGDTYNVYLTESGVNHYWFAIGGLI